MDIYQQKSRWKFYLAIAGAIIVVVTMVYSNYLAQRLATEEQNNVTLFARAIEELSKNNDLTEDIGIEFEIVQTLNNIPTIAEDEDGTLEGWNFGGEGANHDQVYLEKEKEKILRKGYAPIEGSEGYSSKFYYKNSKLYNRILFFPFVQFLLLSSFVLFGYLSFNASRRAEQNRVWAGMAKETAHQLGTPISAILAWIEILRDKAEDDEDHEIIAELSKDVERLELVADRFSKIGSTPSLEETDMVEEIDKCMIYMKRRMPKKVNAVYVKSENKHLVQMNRHLFDWVVENLIRNALDAMDGLGEIEATVYNEGEHVCVDIVDSGDGIPHGKHKTVFQPGYSTKKRGWGLGLSLAKRIIEEYHQGKIFVKKSIIGEGTTFTIKLPKV